MRTWTADTPANTGQGKLAGKKIGVLVENAYAEHEIFYYTFRFAEEGAEVHLLTRLWGQERLTFEGNEWKLRLDVSESFEGMDEQTLRSYAAIIVPGGMVAEKLLWTEDLAKLPPATEFLQRVFAEKSILKGVNCHGMWLVAPAPELIRDRRAVVHTNILSHVRNTGMIYVDEDVVVHDDLVTGRSADHCHLFARTIIDLLSKPAEE
ncbi:MAG: DJ-1/PfpI family protein [Egibacteraceae bacterium]